MLSTSVSCIKLEQNKNWNFLRFLIQQLEVKLLHNGFQLFPLKNYFVPHLPDFQNGQFYHLKMAMLRTSFIINTIQSLCTTSFFMHIPHQRLETVYLHVYIHKTVLIFTAVSINNIAFVSQIRLWIGLLVFHF